MRDRFGNEHAPGVPYARGKILTSSATDFGKMREAWRHIEARVLAGGPNAVFNFSGLEHGLPLEAAGLPYADDFIAPAVYFEKFRKAALDHFGGTDGVHDAALFNRLTGATYATHLTLVKPGDVVIGVSASYSHPSVVRAVAQAGAKLVDTCNVDQFNDALDRESNVGLVVLTRLAVTYEIMPVGDIEDVVRRAHDRNIPVYVDDAGGARVGPAVFDQPRTLQLGVDLVGTGLDKYGTVGPRLGVMAGETSLVERVRVRGYEMGLEARPFLYGAAFRSLAGSTSERVQHLVQTSREVAAAVRTIVGDRVHETPVIAELLAEDILEIAVERAGLKSAPIVPYEAASTLAMLLLRDHGIITVQFVGIPAGTSAVMLKFISPEALARFGGPAAYARAIDDRLTKLSKMLRDEKQITRLLLGE